MKSILTICFILISVSFLDAQCECTDCPIPIISQASQSSLMDISGATNNTLGSNNQQLCMVCISMNHDAIEEIDMILYAPNGSSVELMLNTGISVGDNLTFNICFVSCDQSASPDSGHGAVFDSSEDWGSNMTYDGTYYPSNGCLEDLTGDVNGTWELEIEDFIFLDDGTLFDWYMVFTDDAGLNCANADDCDNSTMSCLAEGGELNYPPVIECEGSPDLDLDIEASFPNNNEAPTPDYDYSWVIADADTDVIEDISTGTDLSAYPPGNYKICGLSFLVADEPLIPSADGSTTVSDIEDEIDDEAYCADLSDDCVEVTIEAIPVDPDIDGPIELCVDEIGIFTILNFDPNATYSIDLFGVESHFVVEDETIEIAWTEAPAEFCVTIESTCGDLETCFEVDLLSSPEDFEIVGNLEPCPGSTEIYDFLPASGSGESYDVTITGGTILSQSDDSVEIEWPDAQEDIELCIELAGAPCPVMQFCETIEVGLDFEIPNALNSPFELCDGGETTSFIEGDNAVSEYIWFGSNITIIDGQNSDLLEYAVSGPGQATVCLEIITACGMQGPICEDIDVLEVPNPTIGNVSPGCSLSFMLTSNANSNNDILWELVSGPGTADFEDSDGQNTEVTVSETGRYLFQIEELNDPCVGLDTLTVDVLNALNFSSLDYTCNSQNQYTVSFTILSGDAPFSVNGQALVGNTFTSDFIDSGSAFTYDVTDSNGCTVTIVNNHICPCTLEIIDIAETCDGTGDNYVLSFQVIGGDAPYATSLPGQWVGNTFTSDPIPSGQVYSIRIIDMHSCESLVITGNKLCDCISDAGFMSTDPINICVSEDSISVDAVLQSVLDSDDIGFYFLHTSPTNIITDTLAVSSTGVFYYNSFIELDSVYYVSYAVGNDLGGMIDPNDPCLDVSSGQPVMWVSIPSVNAGFDQTSCDYNFQLLASPIIGQWRMITSPTNSLLASFSSSANNLSLPVDEVGEYSLSWTADNGSCAASDTILLTLNASPVILGIETECNANALTYDLTIFIEDNSNSLTVNGMASSSTYIENNLEVNQNHAFVIENAFGCITEFNVFDINCDCDAEAGTVDGTVQNLCIYDSIDVNISNGGYILEPGDTIAYVLHDGTSFDIGNVIYVSYGENIPFDENSMDDSANYTLNLIVGNIVNGMIDLDDACLQVSPGVPITFLPSVEVNIDGQYEGCIGDQISVFVQSTSYPINVELENENGRTISVEVIDDQTEVLLDVESSSDVWTVKTVDSFCFTVGPGFVEIVGQDPSTFNLLEEYEICNNPIFGSTVEASDLFIGDMPVGEWQLIGGIELNNGVFDFTNLQAGFYSIPFSTVGFDNLCPGMISNIEFTVVECDCSIFENPDIEICSMDTEYDLSDFDTKGWEGSWAIINANSFASPPMIANDKLIIANGNEGAFEMIYTITDPNYPPNCDQSTSFLLIIESPLQAGSQTEFQVYCEDGPLNIDLFDLLSNYDTGGNWTFEGVPVPSGVINTSSLEIGDNMFRYELSSSSICPQVFSEAVVTLIENIDLQVDVNNVLCFGDDNGEIMITIGNPNGEDVDCFLNNIIQDDGKVISGLSAGTYQVYAKRGFCQSVIQEIVITEPSPVFVQLGDDLEVEIFSEITIEAIVNILESDIVSVRWSDLEGILQIDALELTSIFDNNNTISIAIEDENGCIAEDEIEIRVTLPELDPIYIPNIINPESNDANNVFSLQNTGHVELVNTFYIYDRWGNIVYQKEDLPPDNSELSWNGYYDDKQVEQGVYVYLVEVTYDDGRFERFVGDITFIK